MSTKAVIGSVGSSLSDEGFGECNDQDNSDSRDDSGWRENADGGTGSKVEAAFFDKGDGGDRGGGGGGDC